MTRFLFGDLLWRAITNSSKKAQRIKAAIAYVTQSRSLDLKSADVLIVDATDRAIASGQTAAAVLDKLLKENVELYSHPGLHAKIVIADSVLFASSANFSASSVSKLLEAGIETDSPNAVSGAVGLIEKLIERSTLIDTAFIARIKKIKVIKQYGGGTSKAKAPPKGYRDPVTWLVGVHDIDEPRDPEEKRRVELGTVEAEQLISNPKSSSNWIRYHRTVRIGKQARRGDSLVIIGRPTAKANPKRIYSHAPVLLVQKEPNCTRLFYEDFRDAEKKSLSWLQFRRLAKLVGLPDQISKDTIRLLSDKHSADIREYWEQVRRK